MRNFIILTFIFFATPVFSAGPAIDNAGFVRSNIWYSKDPFYAGDKIRIYTVIYNGSPYDLSGEVEFLDNNALIGKTDFALSNGGRVRDLWIDWKATEGKHAITARFAGVVADGPNGKETAILGNAEAGKSEVVVELDPILKAAQEKANAEKTAELRAEATAKVESAVTRMNSAIPEPVKESVSSGKTFLEGFRLGEAYQIKLAKEGQQKNINAIKESEKQARVDSEKTVQGATDAMLNTAEKPFAYMLLAILTVAQYFFQWSILFYGVLLYTLYRVIKWIARKARNRE